MVTRSTDVTEFGLRGGADAVSTNFEHNNNTMRQRYSGSIPLNTTPEGLARTIKAQYYKNGAANFLRTDGFGATGVICVGDTEEPMYGDTDNDI